MKVPAPPDDLSIASQAAWAGLAADVAVVNGGAAIDYILLADVCRARDRLAAIGEAIAADGVTVTGSMGQLRPHPLLAIEQALRREVAQGLDRLQLSPAQRSHYLAIGRDGRIIEE